MVGVVSLVVFVASAVIAWWILKQDTDKYVARGVAPEVRGLAKQGRGRHRRHVPFDADHRLEKWQQEKAKALGQLRLGRPQEGRHPHPHRQGHRARGRQSAGGEPPEGDRLADPHPALARRSARARWCRRRGAGRGLAGPGAARAGVGVQPSSGGGEHRSPGPRLQRRRHQHHREPGPARPQGPVVRRRPRRTGLGRQPAGAGQAAAGHAGLLPLPAALQPGPRGPGEGLKEAGLELGTGLPGPVGQRRPQGRPQVREHPPAPSAARPASTSRRTDWPFAIDPVGGGHGGGHPGRRRGLPLQVRRQVEAVRPRRGGLRADARGDHRPLPLRRRRSSRATCASPWSKPAAGASAPPSIGCC